MDGDFGQPKHQSLWRSINSCIKFCGKLLIQVLTKRSGSHGIMIGPGGHGPPNSLSDVELTQYKTLKL